MQLILGPVLSTPQALLPFALGNALTEELESRVILLAALGDSGLGLVLHAVLFGAHHAVAGFPSGAGGWVLASVRASPATPRHFDSIDQY